MFQIWKKSDASNGGVFTSDKEKKEIIEINTNIATNPPTAPFLLQTDGVKTKRNETRHFYLMDKYVKSISLIGPLHANQMNPRPGILPVP